MSKVVKKEEHRTREQRALSLENPARLIPIDEKNNEPFWSRKGLNSIFPRRLEENRKPR